MRKYPHLLTIFHSTTGINSPIRLIIASTMLDTKNVLHSLICSSIEHRGEFLKVMDEDKLVDVFISAHLFLNGAVQVSPADLSSGELETFNKCANPVL